jgi:TPR repeat protein
MKLLFAALVVAISGSFVSLSADEIHDPRSVQLQDKAWDRYQSYDISSLRPQIDTLTANGFYIDASYDAMYKVAEALEKSGKTEESILIINRLLRTLETDSAKLEITQFHDILLIKAYAYADSSNQGKAIDIYEQMMDLLIDGEHKNKIIGIPIYFKSPEATVQWLLAGLYQDKFVSETTLRDWVQARQDLLSAVGIYAKINESRKIEESYNSYYANAKALNEKKEMDWCLQEYKNYQALPAFQTSQPADVSQGAPSAFVSATRTEQEASAEIVSAYAQVLDALLSDKAGADVMVRVGADTTFDNAKAVEAFKKAADQGLAVGEYGLGVAYLGGLGIVQDRGQAFAHFQKAADKGNPSARFNLGKLYAAGIGVERDPVQAYRWFSAAAALLSPEEKESQGRYLAERDGLADTMTVAQIAAALDILTSVGTGKATLALAAADAAKRYQTSAASGDPVAQYRLGKALGEGVGIRRDDAQAVLWLRKAADQGNADAQNALGGAYYRGAGVPKDLAESARWWKKAAEQGNVEAAYDLALAYNKGIGVAKNPAEAARLMRQAAEAGDATSQFLIGAFYREGTAIAQDFTEAARWFRKAADAGNATAQFRLGTAYFLGQGLAKDENEAMRWWFKALEQGDKTAMAYMQSAENWRAAAEGGDAIAQFWLGCCCLQGNKPDFAEAEKWIRKAADKGIANAQNALGGLYDDGLGVPQDKSLAVQWYQKAADQGLIASEFALAGAYYKGSGVPKDLPLSLRWLEKAAGQGDAEAQYNAGSMYEKGRGGAQDAAKAVFWYRKAAEQCYSKAQYNLAVMYLQGNGVRKDPILAYMWLSLSLNYSQESASVIAADKAARDKVAKALSPAQIAQAMELASEWRPAKGPATNF